MNGARPGSGAIATGADATGELAGRTIMVTGATSGIGLVTARALVRRGARVVLACRSPARADAIVAGLRAEDPNAGGAELDVLELDLADLASVRRAAATFLARGTPLHGLVNNAGLAGFKGLTADGFELTFGINHLGHFLLTLLLEPRLRESAPARVVNVASEAHRQARGVDFARLRRTARSISGLSEYAVSKLCNLLFTRTLAERWRGTGVVAHAVHPGAVATHIWRQVPQPLRWLITRPMRSPEVGARPLIFCVTAPELASVTGRYFGPHGELTPSRFAQDDELAGRLWEESESYAGLR